MDLIEIKKKEWNFLTISYRLGIYCTIVKLLKLTFETTIPNSLIPENAIKEDPFVNMPIEQLTKN